MKVKKILNILFLNFKITQQYFLLVLSKISNLEKFLSKLGNKEEELRPLSVEKSKTIPKSSISAKSKSSYEKNKPILQFYDKNPVNSF